MSACLAIEHMPTPVAAAMIARLAVEALRLELDTYPKPGLVSRLDSGSHADMDAGSFEASAAALEPYFERLARAGAERCSMAVLRPIGIEAEFAMRAATGGINTHRGAIFGLGLLVSAAGALTCGQERTAPTRIPAPRDSARQIGRLKPCAIAMISGTTLAPVAPGSLGANVRNRHAADILGGPELLHAPGARARRRFRVGGAPAEAAAGFPTLYRVGLPALRRGRQLRPGNGQAARVEACMALIAALEDTNLLHRGGETGLDFARSVAAAFVRSGGVGRTGWHAEAESIHHAFVARRLSPGGAADLLAMPLFVAAIEDGENAP